ncbi:MAG: helix-turn-helix transcriptional regulator [Eubacteriales bacterium]|nr:helix-turn-helix transcriptional regulator [Eubacteriales bacterium]
MLTNERIRALRKNRYLSQRTIAKLLYISPRTYCDYESGRLRVPVDCLIRLAKYYDCSIDYITGASNVRRPYPDQ